MSTICIILIAIAVGLCCPPLALFILILAAGVIGILPAIIYAFVISGIYAVKKYME